MGRAEYRESLKKDKNRKKKRTEVSQEKAANIHATGDVTIQPAKSQGNSGIEEKKRKKKTAVIIFLILLIAAGAVAAWMFWPRAKSQYDVDREALEGFLPGRSQEEIEAELNRIIAKGRFNVSINPTPIIKDGKINVMIENVPANNYFMQVDVFFKTKDGDQKIYSSGIIKQGFYIDEATTDTKLPPGDYDGYAVFHALKPETLEEIGQTNATLAGKVE